MRGPGKASCRKWGGSAHQQRARSTAAPVVRCSSLCVGGYARKVRWLGKTWFREWGGSCRVDSRAAPVASAITSCERVCTQGAAAWESVIQGMGRQRLPTMGSTAAPVVGCSSECEGGHAGYSSLRAGEFACKIRRYRQPPGAACDRSNPRSCNSCWGSFYLARCPNKTLAVPGCAECDMSAAATPVLAGVCEGAWGGGERRVPCACRCAAAAVCGEDAGAAEEGTGGKMGP